MSEETPEPGQHSAEYNRGWADGQASGLDACQPVIDKLQSERAAVDAALRASYEAMDAACRWAANETAGVKTVEDADRHMRGYDALLDATVRAGIAAGFLRELFRVTSGSPAALGEDGDR